MRKTHWFGGYSSPLSTDQDPHEEGSLWSPAEDTLTWKELPLCVFFARQHIFHVFVMFFASQGIIFSENKEEFKALIVVIASWIYTYLPTHQFVGFFFFNA